MSLQIPDEYICVASGVPPHILPLKIGAVCFLERNLSVQDRLMHNSKVVVTALRDRFIEVQLLDQQGPPESKLIPRTTFKETWPGTGIVLERIQFPLRLAYAVTYNKSQGQTLEYVVLDVRNPVFAHGQLYVGLTRVRTRFGVIALAMCRSPLLHIRRLVSQCHQSVSSTRR